MTEDRHPRQKSAALRTPTAFERCNSRDTESLHTKPSVSKQVLTRQTPPSSPGHWQPRTLLLFPCAILLFPYFLLLSLFFFSLFDRSTLGKFTILVSFQLTPEAEQQSTHRWRAKSLSKIFKLVYVLINTDRCRFWLEAAASRMLPISR